MNLWKMILVIKDKIEEGEEGEFRLRVDELGKELDIKIGKKDDGKKKVIGRLNGIKKNVRERKLE